jgi:hypothetical protein
MTLAATARSTGDAVELSDLLLFEEPPDSPSGGFLVLQASGRTPGDWLPEVLERFAAYPDEPGALDAVGIQVVIGDEPADGLVAYAELFGALIDGGVGDD